MTACVVDWTLVLEYAKVVLSWPPIVFVLGLVVVALFKPDLAALAARIKKWSFAGAEVQFDAAQQQQPQAALEPVKTLDSTEQYIAANPSQVRHDIQLLDEMYQFERAFSVMFGTQLRLLSSVERAAAPGEPLSSARLWHEEHQKLAAASGGSASPLAAWMEYLTAHGLVETRLSSEGADPRVVATPRGLRFLTYLRKIYSAALPFRWA